MESNFDYIEFARVFRNQARNIVPFDLRFERDFVADKVEKHIIQLAQGFQNEIFSDNFNDEKYVFSCQVIAEWTFHKSIDLLNSHIPPEYYDEILNNICYVIYELLKKYLDENRPQDYILERIETEVKFEYKKILEDYSRRGIIDEVEKNYALNLSSLDKMSSDKINQDNSAFYTIQQDESKYLKDKVLISYAGNLTYKYMLIAARVLKKSHCNEKDRRIVVEAFRNSMQALISKIEGFEDFELNVPQIERLVTVAAELMFHRIVVLHKLNMLEHMSETEYALEYFATVIFDLEMVYIKDNDKLKDTFEYTKGFANNNFKKYFKDYVDDGTITREQYNALLGKSYLVYLMPTINKLMYPKKSDKLKDIIFWSLFAILMIAKIILHLVK